MEHKILSELDRRGSYYRLGVIVFLITALCLLGVASPAPAQNSTNEKEATPDAEPSSLDKEYEFLKKETREFRGFIENERRQHREFIENERKEHQKFLHWSIYVIGIVIAVASAIFGFLGVKTLSDAKKMVRGYVDTRLNDFVDGKIDSVRTTIVHMAQDVLREELSLKRRVWFLVPADQQQEIETGEIEILKKRGFENIELKNIDEPFDERCGLFVFYYDKSVDEHLTRLVLSLQGSNRPLIVYSTERVENEALEGYKWRAYANTPLTLTNWVFTVLMSFEPRR